MGVPNTNEVVSAYQIQPGWRFRLPAWLAELGEFTPEGLSRPVVVDQIRQEMLGKKPRIVFNGEWSFDPFQRLEVCD